MTIVLIKPDALAGYVICYCSNSCLRSKHRRVVVMVAMVTKSRGEVTMKD